MPARDRAACSSRANMTDTKLGPRWARGSEPWPAQWRGSVMALVCLVGGAGARNGGGSAVSGDCRGGGGRSGGLRRGDGDGGAGVEFLQLPQQVGLALFG